MQCGILGYGLVGMCFSSGSRRHMLVTFHVWDAVIYLSTAEPKSMMCNSDWGNRGVGNWEWSRMEQNGAEWSRMEWNRAEQSGIRIIRIKIKIKEKCDIITVPHTNGPCPHGLMVHPPSSGWLLVLSRRVGLLRSVRVSAIEVLFKIEIVVSLL